VSAATLAGWIVLGVCCVASLGLLAAGAIRVAGAQRSMKRSLARIEATQRRAFDVERFQNATARITRDAAEAKLLLERAKAAIGTIVRAVRLIVLAARVVRSLC
jgi:hypothetical protein